MSTSLTVVSAANCCDSTGTKIANATIYFQPCNNAGDPRSFQVGGTGQATARPVSTTVTAGVFSISLADTSKTEPANVGYLVSIVDNLSGDQLLGPGYIIQPTGATWSFDDFVPNVPALAIIQTGPQGQGFTNRGAWAADTAYNAYDFYQVNGSTYLVVTPYTSGATFGATDTANTDVLAASGALTGTLAAKLVAAYGASITGGLSVDTVSPTGNSLDIAGSANASGLITDSQDFLIDPTDNNLDIVWGVADRNLRTYVAVRDDNTFLAGDIQSTGTVRSSEDMDLTVPNNLGVVGGFLDEQGNAIFGLKADGGFVSNGATRQITNQILTDPTVGDKAPRDTDNAVYYTANDSSGKSQIWRFDRDLMTSVQLTTTGNNTQPSPSQDGTWILFQSDRSGTVETWKMTRYGDDQMLATQDPTKLVNLWHLDGKGQSLMVGSMAAAAVTTTQPFDNLMFNSDLLCGVVDYSTVFGPVASSDIASFQPLTGVIKLSSAAGQIAETAVPGCVNSAVASLLTAGIPHRIFGSIAARSSYSYAQLAKGTTTYSNMLAEVQAAHTIAAAQGMTHACRASLLVHGEQDETIANPNYTANLITWQSDSQTDLSAITGQTISIPFILDQLSSWPQAANTAQGVIPMQQVAAWKQYPNKFLIACALYRMNHANGLHLDAETYRLMGEYFGKVYAQLIQGKTWTPVYPKWNKIAKLGTQIFIPFYVPRPPLVFDTTDVTEPSFVAGSKYGFEVYDSNNNPVTISSAEIVGRDLTTVCLNLATDPGAGASVAYAFTAAPGVVAGPTTGPRGNLRDSDPTTTYYPYKGAANYPLYNWGLHFKEPIPAF